MINRNNNIDNIKSATTKNESNDHDCTDNNDHGITNSREVTTINNNNNQRKH